MSFGVSFFIGLIMVTGGSVVRSVVKGSSEAD